MRKFYRLKAGAVLIFLIGQTLLFPLLVARASSVPSPALAVDVSKITSLGAMRTWMDSLYAECLQAKQDSRFTFELQERILKKSGDSISRILKLEQQGKSPAQKAFRAAFEKNEAIFQFIIQSNEEVVEEIQEEKLDKVEDTQAFLDSTEWQMPHRMISLSRYWMSWSRYYRSLLYPEGDPEASSLLSEAIGGFSLTLFDLEDPTIVAKSLFGRALCFKEMKKYKKAVEDLASITQNVRHNDPLYIWSLYEQALIAYRLRNYETALANLDTLETGIEEQTVSHVLGNEHKRLRERVVLEPRVTALLAKLNKETDTTGEAAKQLCHELHGALKRLSLYDAAHATRLYRLVVEHPAFFPPSPMRTSGLSGTWPWPIAASNRDSTKMP